MAKRKRVTKFEKGFNDLMDMLGYGLQHGTVKGQFQLVDNSKLYIESAGRKFPVHFGTERSPEDEKDDMTGMAEILLRIF